MFIQQKSKMYVMVVVVWVASSLFKKYADSGKGLTSPDLDLCDLESPFNYLTITVAISLEMWEG